MRRWVVALVLPLIVSFGLVGCGSKTNSTTTNTPPANAASCPTTTQKSFVKTRFVADLGLIIGSAKHFIYTPYTQGSFTTGSTFHKVKAIAKAGAAALVIEHFTKNAISNAEADPTLCKVLVQPMQDVANALGAVKDKLLHGDTSGITNLSGSVSTLESTAKSNGLNVVEGLIPGVG